MSIVTHQSGRSGRAHVRTIASQCWCGGHFPLSGRHEVKPVRRTDTKISRSEVLVSGIDENGASSQVHRILSPAPTKPKTTKASTIREESVTPSGGAPHEVKRFSSGRHPCAHIPRCARPPSTQYTVKWLKFCSGHVEKELVGAASSTLAAIQHLPTFPKARHGGLASVRAGLAGFPTKSHRPKPVVFAMIGAV